MGEVRQDVKTSAGRSGQVGNVSFAAQAASCSEFIIGWTPSG